METPDVTMPQGWGRDAVFVKATTAIKKTFNQPSTKPPFFNLKDGLVQPGEAGVTGAAARSPVVEELKKDLEAVSHQVQPVAVGNPTSPGSVTTANVGQVLLTVPGEGGLTGLHVPRAVVEELRPGGDSVTVQPRHTVVQTVRVRSLRRDSVTFSPALPNKVNNCSIKHI